MSKFLGKPRTVVQRYLARPRDLPERPEDVEILFPVNVLTPRGSCPHGVIADGDRVYCPKCDLTGIEGHPGLRRPVRKTRPRKEPAKFRPKGKQPAA